jgi:uncharacterized membrane protein YphA (DoxX/SURF4 family)
MINSNNVATYLLRVGLSFVLLYASVEVYIHPANFLKYVPKFIFDIIPQQLFLDVFAVAEIILSVWLLSGWKGKYPALISVLLMVGIIAFNTEYFQILFRNVAIAFGGLALVALEQAREKISEKVSVKASEKMNDISKSKRPYEQVG